MSLARILVVDDDPAARMFLRRGLEAAGYEVFEANNSDAAMRAIVEHPVDLITLDIKLGSESGLDVARSLRAVRNVPIVMITACNAPPDRVTGLENGADDYIIKPFHIQEVILRVQRVVERYQPLLVEHEATSASVPAQYWFDSCIVDGLRREARRVDGQPINLTDVEFRLLYVLVQNAARVLSRDDLSRAINGHGWDPLDRTIDGHIARLRRKVEHIADEPKLIKSVRGVGYVFASEVRRL